MSIEDEATEFRFNTCVQGYKRIIAQTYTTKVVKRATQTLSSSSSRSISNKIKKIWIKQPIYANHEKRRQATKTYSFLNGRGHKARHTQNIKYEYTQNTI